MPIVKMPNGETIKFPDDMPEDQLSNAVSLYAKKFESPISESMSPLQRFGIGAGYGMEQTGLGLAQRIAEMQGPVSGQSNNILDVIKARVAANRQAYAPLQAESDKTPIYNPSAQGVGEMLGGAAVTAPIPGGSGKTALGIIGNAALQGGIQGFIQPTVGDESVMKNTLAGAGAGGVLGPAAAGVGKVYNAIANPIKNATQQLADKYGIGVTLGEATNNPLWKTAESWLEKVPIIGLKSFRQKQNEESQQAATGFFSKYVVKPTEQTTADMKVSNDQYLDSLYNSFRKQIEGVPPAPATITHDATAEMLDRFPSVFDSIQDNHVKKILKDIYGDTTDKTVNTKWGGGGEIPDTWKETPMVTVNDLWELRKGIGREIRDAKSETARGQLGKVYSAVSDDMDSILAQANNPGAVAFKEANDAFKQYSVKFDVLRTAYDKATGTTGAGEMFSPKIFSTALKNLAEDPNYKRNVKWSPGEVDQMTGLAEILQVAKRSGQFQENPPTGNRWGPFVAAAELASVGGLSLVGVTRFLTSTELGKSLATSASKIEPTSPAMNRIMNMVYTMAPRMVSQGVNQRGATRSF
jgi:hypothetical protein